MYDVIIPCAGYPRHGHTQTWKMEVWRSCQTPTIFLIILLRKLFMIMKYTKTFHSNSFVIHLTEFGLTNQTKYQKISFLKIGAKISTKRAPATFLPIYFTIAALLEQCLKCFIVVDIHAVFFFFCSTHIHCNFLAGRPVNLPRGGTWSQKG